MSLLNLHTAHPFTFHQPLSLSHVSSGVVCTTCMKPIMVVAMECQKKCHTFCMDCYESHLVRDNFSINVTKHPHKLYQTNYRNPNCDECGDSFLKEAYSCEFCDYDMCEHCVWKFRRVEKPVSYTATVNPDNTYGTYVNPDYVTTPINEPRPKCPSSMRYPQPELEPYVSWNPNVGSKLISGPPSIRFTPAEIFDLQESDQLFYSLQQVSKPSETTSSAIGSNPSCSSYADFIDNESETCNQMINRSRMYMLVDEVYMYLRESHNIDNFVISPFSIYMAFSLALAGCTPSSITEFEIMNKIIGINNVPRKNVLSVFSSSMKRAQNQNSITFKVANAIFSKAGSVTDEYKRLLSDVLYSESRDLTNEYEINKWCSEKTQGKISHIVSDGFITDDMNAILVNAIYFDAKWNSPFKSVNTTKGAKFTRENGTERICDMMHQETHIPYIESENFRACSLAYKGGQYSAWFALPTNTDPRSIHDLKIVDVHNAVCKHDGTSGTKKAPISRKVSLYCPKFHAEFGPFEMKSVFKRMGVSVLFLGERTASGDDGFSVMVGNNPQYKTFVSNIIHKAVCDVDEDGTVASAVTAIATRNYTCMPNPTLPVIFCMNRPFVFMIVDNNSDECIFAGKIFEP